MQLNRKTQTLVGLLALLLAVLSGGAVYWFLGTFAATTRLPVPNQPIPAGALITTALLTEREVPRALRQEPIYTEASDLVGKVAQIPLAPGQVIYHQHAVPLRDYRLVDDPQLVVVSVPLSPDRAVGGQIQPGHRVDVWTLPLTRQREDVVLTATLVLTDVLVVDVRASQGQAVARQPQAVPGQIQPQNAGAQPSSAAQGSPLQILTVALPVTHTTRLLDTLAATENGLGTLWIALAPVVRPAGSPARPTTVAQLAATPTPPTPTPPPPLSPAPTETAIANPRYRVTGTGGTLRVREAPQGPVVGTVPEGAVVYQLEGPQTMGGTAWYRVMDTAQQLTGWVAVSYLEEVQEP